MKKKIILLALSLALLSGCTQSRLDAEYQSGYSNGYEDGKIEGYNEGVFDYKDSGYQKGYEEGYNEGFADTYYDYNTGYLDGYEGIVSFYEKYEGHGRFDASLIPMLSVQSSFINSVGYSPTYSVLLINMNENDLYAYYDVKPMYFENLYSTVSPGSYFNAAIKNKFEYAKL